MTKKTFTYLMVSALSLSLLAACDQQEKEETNKETESSQVEQTESSSDEKEARISKEELDQLPLPQLSKEVAADEALVAIETNFGTMKAKLFPTLAPKAVENFLTHVKEGYYDGLTFHRVIQDFMIQGGDPKGDGTGGESIWGEEFVPEISDQLYHIRGALAMARTGLPVDQPSQGSQFYIVQNDKDQQIMIDQAGDNPQFKPEDEYPTAIYDAYKEGGVPSLDGQYSVFGQVIEGLDVVDQIAATPVDQNDKPKEPVTITHIEILKEAE